MPALKASNAKNSHVRNSNNLFDATQMQRHQRAVEMNETKINRMSFQLSRNHTCDICNVTFGLGANSFDCCQTDCACGRETEWRSRARQPNKWPEFYSFWLLANRFYFGIATHRKVNSIFAFFFSWVFLSIFANNDHRGNDDDFTIVNSVTGSMCVRWISTNLRTIEIEIDESVTAHLMCVDRRSMQSAREPLWENRFEPDGVDDERKHAAGLTNDFVKWKSFSREAAQPRVLSPSAASQSTHSVNPARSESNSNLQFLSAQMSTYMSGAFDSKSKSIKCKEKGKFRWSNRRANFVI